MTSWARGTDRRKELPPGVVPAERYLELDREQALALIDELQRLLDEHESIVPRLRATLEGLTRPPPGPAPSNE